MLRKCSKRKVIICIFLVVLAIILCVTNYYVFKNTNSSPQKTEDMIISEDGIINPDRIVIKVDGLFYEIYGKLGRFRFPTFLFGCYKFQQYT